VRLGAAASRFQGPYFHKTLNSRGFRSRAWPIHPGNGCYELFTKSLTPRVAHTLPLIYTGQDGRTMGPGLSGGRCRGEGMLLHCNGSHTLRNDACASHVSWCSSKLEKLACITSCLSPGFSSSLEQSRSKLLISRSAATPGCAKRHRQECLCNKEKSRPDKKHCLRQRRTTETLRHRAG